MSLVWAWIVFANHSNSVPLVKERCDNNPSSTSLIPLLPLQLCHISLRMLLREAQAHCCTVNRKKLKKIIEPKETKDISGWPRSLGRPTLLACIWKSFLRTTTERTGDTKKYLIDFISWGLNQAMHRNHSKQHSKAAASFGVWVVKGTKAVGESLGEKRSDIWEEKW